MLKVIEKQDGREAGKEHLLLDEIAREGARLRRRDLSEREYVYVWVDGIHSISGWTMIGSVPW
jgi:hypothetical protein